MNWLTNFLETYQKGKEYDKDISLLKLDINVLENLTAKQKADLIQLNYENDILKTLVPKPNAIDIYLSKYTFISNIAYSDKREYSVYLNQMITPDAFEVLKFKKGINGTDYEKIYKLGNKLARHTTWVSEADLYDSGDRYLYPEETLTFMRAKCDCEDVSFVMASFFPEICGVCYGFYHKGNTKFGHAYPIFVWKDKLYIVETTGNSVEITSFEDERYETYFIVTKEKTYKVKSGVVFGTIAQW